MRTMYDSVTASDIPEGAQMVAGYVDGAYAWSYNDWARHGSATQVRITVLGQDLSAQVADYEPGNLSMAQLIDWVKAKGARGEMPTVYFSLSLYGTIEAAFKAAGITNADWLTWVADWNNQPNLEPGWTAHQYAHPPESGGHYDLSVVADYWPGVDPARPSPVPPPGPPPPPPPPTPPPDTGPPIDQTRSAWQNLATWLTQDLPAAIQELLRLLGLFQNSP